MAASEAFNPASLSLLIPIEDELRALADPRAASEKTPAAMQAASSAPDAATKEVMDRMLRAVDLTQLRVHSDVRPPNFLGAGAEPVARTPASAPAASSASGADGVCVAGGEAKAPVRTGSKRSRDVTPASPAPSELAVGARVLARFKRRDRFFPGVITAVNRDNCTVSVCYDDGDEEEDVREQDVKPADPAQVFVKPMPAPTPAPTRAPAPAPAPSSAVRRQSSMVKAVPPAAPPVADGEGSSERLLELLEGIDASAEPARSLIASIATEVRAMPETALLAVPKPSLRALLDALQLVIGRAAEAAAAAAAAKEKARSKARAAAEAEDGEGDAMDDEEDEVGEDTGGATLRAHALEATLLLLSLVSVPKMPPDLLVEEALEAAIGLAKRELARTLAGDASSSVPSGGLSTPNRGGAKGRPAKVPRVTPGSAGLVGGVGGAGGGSIAATMTLVLERLPSLARSGVSDGLVLQLISLGLSAAFGTVGAKGGAKGLGSCLPIQMAGMRLLLALFAEYPSQRRAILLDLIEKRLASMLSPSRESRRNFALPDGSRVQMFTALKARTKAAAEAEAAAKAAAAAHPRNSVKKLMGAALQTFAAKCLDHADDAENKVAFEEFVRDVLHLTGRPEWPAAPHVADRMGTILCQRLGAPKEAPKSAAGRAADTKEQHARTLALEQLGALLATLYEHKRKHADAPLTFPLPKEDVNMDAQPNDKGEIIGCPCGVTEYDKTQSFMLDCDLCHQWFHGECMGVGDSKTDKEWYCDHCRLSTSVNDQPLCTEAETTKQLVLNYVQASASADPAADTAASHMLCEWHQIAMEKKQRLLCDLYQEQQRLTLVARRRHQSGGVAGGEADAMRELPLLSREGILVACRQLMADGGLFAKGEVMLSYLLAYVHRDPQPSTRARALKALREVIKADPSVLSLKGVAQTVQGRLRDDSSIAVRESVLDLLGEYLRLKPELITQYYATIASRLSDPGVSVRRAGAGVGSVADGPLSPSRPALSASDRAIDACCRMVLRLGPNEEEEVHKLVLKAFSDLWFAPNADDPTAPLESSDCIARCEMLVGVVARTAAAGMGDGQADVGAKRCEWLGSLLARMLKPPSVDGKPSATALREAAVAEKVCHQLVAQLMESLLQRGEADALNAAPDSLEARTLMRKMGETLQALSLFCTAMPQLLLPHIAVLTQFLHYESATRAVQHICEMLPALLRILEHPPSKLLADLEKFLSALIYRVKESLLTPTILAFAMTIQASGNATLIVRILANFHEYLEDYRVHMSERPDEKLPARLTSESLRRSFICAGLLCRYYDFDAPAAVVEAHAADGKTYFVGKSVIEHVYRTLRELTRPALPPMCVLYAYKGLGAVLVRKPEMLVPCRDLFARALAPQAPAKLKRQALDNLRLLLTADEERQRTLSASSGATGSAKKVAIAELQSAADHSAAVTGSLQSQLKDILAAMRDPRDVSVRAAALALAGALLTNGIAHPAEILPKVLALEVDEGDKEGKEGGTADAAMGELRKHVPPAALAARPKLTALYILHGPNRKHRQAHLRELLGMLNVQQHETLPMAQLADELRLSEWLCHALAEMPYDKEPDVLGLICQANRMLSLDAEPTLAAAGALLGDEAEKQPKPIPVLEAAAKALNGAQVESLQRACHLCAVVGLAHVLKQQLKRAFGISDLRLQAYDPLAELKATERQVARLADVPPLDTSAMWSRALSSAADAGAPAVKKPRKSDGASRLAAPVAAEGVELAVAQYVWLRALLADDEAGFDFNLLLASPKDQDADAESKPARGAGRKSTAAAKQPAAAKRAPSWHGRFAYVDLCEQTGLREELAAYRVQVPLRVQHGGDPESERAAF
ncbi:nipped-b-like protein [Chrysochromulina tobinii]|uniref:Nipped-b-like protein n=1 Tax=Chrysochromulina tobinii TaxID=1460289 RepID=A0A0M0JBC8_9EUKA|nr:nipped-b-like protein [Chrysochromulina tobinii]|eukprot:KOO23662.1 nipped-b-like protein [Chrysochromulina sp. CCMP291]